MPHKEIMRACVILRGVVRSDPSLSGLEISVGDEAVLVTTIDMDGVKQSALVMGPDAAAKFLAPAGGTH
jgi:hypothetical protein